MPRVEVRERVRGTGAQFWRGLEVGREVDHDVRVGWGGGAWGREGGWGAGVGGAIPKDHGSQETKGRVR